jgi:hypothetical protein
VQNKVENCHSPVLSAWFLSETICSAQYTAIPSICTGVPGSTAICYSPGDRAIFPSMKIPSAQIPSPRHETGSPADLSPLTEHNVFRSFGGLLTDFDSQQ